MSRVSFLLLKLKLRVVNNRVENLMKVEAWPQDGNKDWSVFAKSMIS